MSEAILTSNKASAFVQKQAGNQIFYLGECFGMDSFPDSRPGQDAIVCVKNGHLAIIGKKETAPELLSFSIEGLLQSSASWLDVLADQGCSFNLMVLYGCNTIGVFDNNPERGFEAMEVDIVAGEVSDPIQRDADDEVVTSREMNALPPRLDIWQIQTSQKSIAASTEDANSAAATPGSCLNDCGVQVQVGEELWIAHDAGSGVTAEVFRSQDGGLTWAATTLDPFASDENIVSIRVFWVDADTVRLLVLRDTDVAAALEIGYSDDYGATWTNVTVGSTVAEAGVADHSLFVLDAFHIWLATDDGNIYFSGDAGATWSVQSSAITAGGAAALNGVHFISAYVGFAVGATDVVIYTTDGGSNWIAATATGGAGSLLSLWAFDRYRWVVGDDGGSFFITYDGGATWTELTSFQGTGTGSIDNIKFLNELVGFMVHTDGSTVGRILRTINGGYSWTRLPGFTGSAGLNAVMPLGNNHAFAVGDDDATSAIVIEGGYAQPAPL